MPGVSDSELKKVIADFLAMGHVDNIVAMFRREPAYLAFTGEILADERFAVRLGVCVLFEELKESALQPPQLERAIPSLVRLLSSESATIRGEAIGLLGLIGTARAIEHIRAMQGDPSSQVREMVALALEELQ
ncbi:MAG: HEAT repeat domain-containing protein [Desulfopila sp.]